MIRVLIVEDSITQREILKRLVNGDGAFTVVAEAGDGRGAIAKVLQYSPDVVLMDIHMPDMDGIEATRQIMRQCPVPIVVASATLQKQDVNLALQALEAGAVSVISKPQGAVLLHLDKIAPSLRNELLAAATAKVQRRVSFERIRETTRRKVVSRTVPIEIAGLCASTGGPPVLVRILSGLPVPVPVPVLLVQHISAGFEDGFARWLSERTGQLVRIAVSGQKLAPGIWMAPNGVHLTVSCTTRISLPVRASTDIHSPSGNPLFESLARHFGARSVGVLLTGMGDDGAQGLLSLKHAGGLTIIQDEASCLIWGMPKCGKNLNAATHELSPEGITSVLNQLMEPRIG